MIKMFLKKAEQDHLDHGNHWKWICENLLLGKNGTKFKKHERTWNFNR